MAALDTLSAFTYGHTITLQNQNIDFVDDVDILVAKIAVGSYSLEDFGDAIATALNDVATNLTYSVTLDRPNRTFTVTADGNFELLVASGANITTGAFSLMGYTGADTPSATSAVANNPSGSIYFPQFRLQRFTDFIDQVEKSSSVVKSSATGQVEVVSYGDIQFMNCDIMFATDITGQGVIENNATGVADLRAFMTYIIGKHPIEFIPDKDDLNTFTKCILESTRESRNGTAFTLKEMISKGLAYYFETGTLTFRKI